MAPHYGFCPRDLYCRVCHWDKMTMLQYTKNGSLNGYNGLLNVDVYYRNKNDRNEYKNNDKGIDNNLMDWKIKVPVTAYGVF